MQPFQEYIFARFQELESLEEPLRTQLAEIRRERDQLRRAAVAAGISLNPTAEAEELREPPPAAAPQRSLPERTIKEAVIEVLSDHEGGMTAINILSLINRRFKSAYPRTSLSPQLSRLKADGILERNGIVWRLATEKGKPAHPDDHSGDARAEPTDKTDATVEGVEHEKTLGLGL